MAEDERLTINLTLGDISS